jgi:hypothetical protein
MPKRARLFPLDTRPAHRISGPSISGIAEHPKFWVNPATLFDIIVARPALRGGEEENRAL